ncbi:MAG TPA: hypothetical protein VKB41_01620 [Steroidobacteraceae bacterium]|jgi:hypothetical protein|nr:hypothetical protein [Steroidobacteraceae bacterium]
MATQRAQLTITIRGKTATFPTDVTVEADGRIRFVVPSGRIVPGTDATIKLTLNGKDIPVTGASRFNPGQEVTVSASGAVVG